MDENKDTPSARICPHCRQLTPESKCPHDGYPTVDKRHLAPDEEKLVGHEIAGKYKITSIIGLGGVGSVYKAHHIQTDATVAVKILLKELTKSLEAIKRFYNEARLASNLRHPNTVRVFDFGQTEDGHLYMVMEYLEGKTLTKVMKTESPLKISRIVKISEQILRSLGEAHEKGLIHRDLKPDNIFLLDSFGITDFVKVLDFGFAKSIREDHEDLTKSGILVGTPKYMSPEQAKSMKLDGRSDLYSLGVIMYRMFSGVCPFEGTSAMNILMRHINSNPKPLEELCLRPVPSQFSSFVMKMLNKNPDDRFASAMEALQVLEGIESGTACIAESPLEQKKQGREGTAQIPEAAVEVRPFAERTPSTEFEMSKPAMPEKKWHAVLQAFGLLCIAVSVIIMYQAGLFSSKSEGQPYFYNFASELIKNPQFEQNSLHAGRVKNLEQDLRKVLLSLKYPEKIEQETYLPEKKEINPIKPKKNPKKTEKKGWHF
jgi:serine/threonine-protein kinase